MAGIVFKQLVVMMLIMAVSFVMAKRKHYGEKESQYLSYFLVYVISPALIISAYDIPFEKEKWHYCVSMAALTLACMLILILLSLVCGKSRDEKDDRIRSIMKMGVVYSNAGYIGIPIIRATMGDDGVFYLMAFNLVFNLVLWVHGQFLMTRRISVREVLNKPVIIAAIFSVFLFVGPWKLPSVIHQACSLIADMNTVVSMLVLGIVFANFRRPERFPLKQLVLTSVLRLVVSPLLMILLFLPLGSLISSNAGMYMVFMIALIICACPCGVCLTSFSVLYDKDYSFASISVVVTTLLCTLTVPLFTALACRLLS